MAESKVEQIVASIKTDLEAITGDDGATYWYTPGKVIRVDYLESRVSFKDGYGSPIYMVGDTGSDRPSATAAFGETGRALGIFVLAAAQHEDDRDPYTATVVPGTIRNRLVKDVVKKIESNRMRGGLALDTEYLDVKRDFDEPEGWILAEIYFEVTYQHDIGDP